MSYSLLSTSPAGLLHRHDVLDKSWKEENPCERVWIQNKPKGTRGKSRLTFIVHAAVLVLLAGHEGLDLRLGHLLSCGPKGIRVKITLSLSHAANAKQAIFCASIFGDLRPTQGGQHNAQLSTHDCAVALLVEDAQTLNVVVNGALGEGVDLLQHGQESVKVEPLVGHICHRDRLDQGLPASNSHRKVEIKSGRCDGLTVSTRVAQNLRNVLVGGILAQSAHDVGYLVVGHLVVTDSVKETKRLLEVWSGRKNQEKPFS